MDKPLVWQNSSVGTGKLLPEIPVDRKRPLHDS